MRTSHLHLPNCVHGSKTAGGFFLPACLALICLMLTSLSIMSISPGSLIHRNEALQRAAEQLMAHSLVKGFSRPEELGAVTCPDINGDGLPDTCKPDADGFANGLAASAIKVGPGQLILSSGHTHPAAIRLDATVQAALSSGNDITRMAASDASAWILRTRNTSQPDAGSRTGAIDVQSSLDGSLSLSTEPGTAGAFRRVSVKEHTQAVNERLKMHFLEHLQLSATQQGQQFGSAWAFEEVLHLSHDPDSAGSRFIPVNSGCQCSCTKTRCKCACLQTSTWESKGVCQSAIDGGECRTVSSPTGNLTRCTAAPGRYCYLSAETWLSRKWAVSLYTPRATEGRACRPERVETCPLTSKTGSTCTCLFDWPKSVSPERLNRLRLQFENGRARALLLP